MTVFYLTLLDHKAAFHPCMMGGCSR